MGEPLPPVPDIAAILTAPAVDDAAVLAWAEHPHVGIHHYALGAIRVLAWSATTARRELEAARARIEALEAEQAATNRALVVLHYDLNDGYSAEEASGNIADMAERVADLQRDLDNGQHRERYVTEQLSKTEAERDEARRERDAAIDAQAAMMRSLVAASKGARQIVIASDNATARAEKAEAERATERAAREKAEAALANAKRRAACAHQWVLGDSSCPFACGLCDQAQSAEQGAAWREETRRREAAERARAEAEAGAAFADVVVLEAADFIAARHWETNPPADAKKLCAAVSDALEGDDARALRELLAGRALAEAARDMFGPTKDKDGDERDRLDAALAAYDAAASAGKETP